LAQLQSGRRDLDTLSQILRDYLALAFVLRNRPQPLGRWHHRQRTHFACWPIAAVAQRLGRGGARKQAEASRKHLVTNCEPASWRWPIYPGPRNESLSTMLPPQRTGLQRPRRSTICSVPLAHTDDRPIGFRWLVVERVKGSPQTKQSKSSKGRKQKPETYWVTASLDLRYHAVPARAQRALLQRRTYGDEYDHADNEAKDAAHE
jgi:hypothetical protein